jgi:hypothetical protein
MSSFNHPLTPPTTPEYNGDLNIIVFDKFQNIEFRGEKTHEGLKIKTSDLVSQFNLNPIYLRTVAQHLIVIPLRSIYMNDFNNIFDFTVTSEQNLFSEFEDSNELFITFKGLNILAHNVESLVLIRDWLDTVLEDDLKCNESIDYNALGW